MEHGVTPETREIIKYDRVSALGMLIEIGKDHHHAGAAHEVTASRHSRPPSERGEISRSPCIPHRPILREFDVLA
jgi:hypothetical protein